MIRFAVVVTVVCCVSTWLLSAEASGARISVRLPGATQLPSSPGFFNVDATVEAGQERFAMSFGLFLPPGYFRTREPFPVVMALHNRGMEGVGGGAAMGCEGIAYLWVQDEWDKRDPATAPGPDSITLRTSAKFIGVAPQCPRDHPLEVAPMPQVLVELITQLGRVYRMDQNRAYLTGFSWGGTHTWMIAEQTPGRWAAIIPLSAKATEDPAKTAQRLANVPVYLASGGADPYFSQFCRQMSDAFVAAGHKNFVYRVLPQGNHFSYCAVYTDPVFWDWLLSKRRKLNLTTRPTTASATRKS
jgi:hypothetical protein